MKLEKVTLADIKYICEQIEVKEKLEFKSVDDLRIVAQLYYSLNVSLHAYSCLNNFGEHLDFVATKANEFLMDKKALEERISTLESFCRKFIELLNIEVQLAEINVDDYFNQKYIDHATLYQMLYENLCLVLDCQKANISVEPKYIYQWLNPMDMVTEDMQMLYLALKESNDTLSGLLK